MASLPVPQSLPGKIRLNRKKSINIIVFAALQFKSYGIAMIQTVLFGIKNPILWAGSETMAFPVIFVHFQME